MENLILPIFLICGGAFFCIRNLNLLKNKSKIRPYLEKNPKATLWIQKIGIDKTEELTLRYFLPIGVFISICMIFLGLCTFYKIINAQ